MKTRRVASFLALALAAAFSGVASATPVVIQNGYVKAGVSDYGTLGSDARTSPGILYDKTGTGAYGINDFLTPGTPFEGFYLTGTNAAGASISQYSNNTGSSTFNSGSPVSLTSSSAVWRSVSRDGSLGVVNTYTLTTLGGKSVIDVSTALTNLGTGSLNGLKFLRTLDPDPDVNAFGSYFTKNSVISGDQACGTGVSSGQTICIFTNSLFSHKAGVSRTWTTSPSAYLAGLNDGDGDYAIGVAFDLGSLGAGETLTVDLDYVLGASLDVVVSKTPEPGSMLLLGAGLAALGASRRRKSNA